MNIYKTKTREGMNIYKTNVGTEMNIYKTKRWHKRGYEYL